MDSKIKQITVKELEGLAIGSAILGSGGGGDPAVDKLIAQWQLEQYGPVDVMQVNELTEDDLVVPIGKMGAPLVGVEKIASGKEFVAILQKIETYYGKKPTVLLTTEIGGGNAFATFEIAGKAGLPILDADTLGRAFPELQMCSFNVHGISASPAFISDVDGNVRVIEEQKSKDVETVARNITVSFGSTAHIGMYISTGNVAKKAVIPGSISRAIAIGKAVLNAQQNNTNPITAITNAIGGVCIGTGSMVDINQSITSGFLTGTVDIVNAETNTTIQLGYQNEHYIARLNGKAVALTPDIIIPVDIQTGRAITSESMKYGLRVAVLAIPSDPLWSTPKGLELVGPHVFGCDTAYKKVTELLEQL